MTDTAATVLREALSERFGEDFAIDESLPGLDELARIADHRTHRRFLDQAVTPELLRLICACALSAPSKSDLQQCDLVIVSDPGKRQAIAAKIPDMPWIATAPAFLIVAGNARRLPAIAHLRDKPFPNDHLDLFFNAVADSGIVLATFIRAAEAVGLGCCPISAVRDHASFVSDCLALPQRVFPLAGVCVGWPSQRGHLSPRLGLDATLHRDRHDEGDLARSIDVYDRRRAAGRPPIRQRDPERFGVAPFYGWSEDKARQYAEPLRADFGDFVRAKGFRLD